MSGPDPRERDYPIPDDRYTGNLQGGGIMKNSTHWDDQDGHHRESYNYDREGNMENLHHDNEPGPWNR
jgi:hypothetical protein